MAREFDIAIVGGGLVGLMLANLIAARAPARRPRVAVIEAHESKPFDPDAAPGLRVSAISVATQRLFEELGCWEPIAAVRVSPYREMRVWDANGDGDIHFDAAEIGEPVLGHIVENALMQWALEKQLDDAANVTRIQPAALQQLTVTDRTALLALTGDETVAATLVVGADGAASPTRELAGLACKGWPYGQKAVVGNVTTEEPHNKTAWQRFLDNGPLAFLPLADGHSSIVWTTTPERADALIAMNDAAFGKAVTEAFDGTLGGVSPASPRAAFDLKVQYATEYCAHRVTLAGDAAHTVHPLAGMGVNLGFADASELATRITTALASGRDCGDLNVLRGYERARKGENMGTLLLMDGFNRVFGTDDPWIAQARNAALSFANRVKPIKQAFMRRAMG